MIYIIETPHQLPPRAWFARDIEDACDSIASTDPTGRLYIYDWDLPGAMDDALDHNARDLAWQEVLTEDEAKAVANDENAWRTRHHGIEARHALMEVL